MHYGDAVKISGYPSGRKLYELLGDFTYYKLEECALEFFKLPKKEMSHSQVNSFHGLNLRQYPVAEVSTSKLREVIDSAVEELIFKSTKIYQRTNIDNVYRTNSGKFRLYTSSNNAVKQLNFDSVIFATGRAGFSTTDKILTKLGVQSQSPLISIGVRIELPSHQLTPLYNAHKDFKYTEIINGMKVKSFCFSNCLDKGGRLKFCHYQDQFKRDVIFLDGHSNISSVSTNKQFSTGNFALLVQLPTSFDRAWLENDFVEKYYQTTGGKPGYQSAASFIGSEANTITSKPSVNDCVELDISLLFPEKVANSIRSATDSALEVIAKANLLTKEKILESAVVVAPEVEFFWPTIMTNQHFETNVSGLFVIGDSAGIAQGNLQASISGLAAATGIVKNP